MSRFICQFCHHEFSLKTDLDRHLKKKTACIPISQLQIQHTQIQDKSRNVQEISGILKSCLDILRNDESHLTGDEALPELSKMMIYKQMETLIDNGTIIWSDLKNYDELMEKWGESYERKIGFAKFSNLLAYISDKKYPERIENLIEIMNEFLWKTIGSNHPKLKYIFPEDGKFLIKTPQTFKELMVTLSRVDFNKFDFDILGEAYERLFVDAIFGAGGKNKSEFGQFFTPRPVIQFMINLVELNILPNGEIESFADFSCGTGGILITAINHYRKYIQQGIISEGQLREQFKKKLFGIEIKNNLFNLCAANILLHTGEILESIVLGDSIRKYWDIKVDKIVMNPPFSIKIDYDSLFIQRNDGNNLHLHMNDIMPIRVGGKNSESLFLQLMIYCLNIGGKCSTVMLDGQKIDNSSSGNLEVREYLMKSCNLKSVIYCQGGTFTSTSSKTCILHFTKKKERASVLTVNRTGNKREYEFTKTHATKSVKFYDYRPEIEGQKFLLGEIPIEKIAAKKYSLRFQDYDEEEDHEENEGVQWMKIGEICEIDKNLKKYETSHGKSKGNYKFHTGGERTDLYVDKCDITELYIIQNRTNGSGKCNLYLDKNFSLAKQTIAYRALNKDENTTKYIYYYLLFNKEILEKGFIGSCHKNISKEYISNIKIPVPSIEMQQQIVAKIDKYSTTLQSLNNTIELIKESISETIENIYLYPSTEKMKIKELFDFNCGKIGALKCSETGEYQVISSSDIHTHNEYELDGENLFILKVFDGAGNKQYATKIKFFNGKCIPSSLVYHIIPKNSFSLKYAYYYLKHNIKYISEKYQKGACNKSLDVDTFRNFIIPIPSRIEQDSIVTTLNLKNDTIKSIKKTIDSIDIEMKQFMDLLFKSSRNICEE